MTATHGVGTYGNAVGVVTPLDHKMAQLGLIVKTAANTTRPGLFWDGNATIVSGKANMSYDVRALTAVTSRGATLGAVLLTNDAVFNVVTTAAPGSNSRYDHVYLWPREFSIDGTDSNPVIGVVQGTTAASPTVPSLAAFPGAISLATILVPAGVTATNSGTTIAQTAPFTSVDGGRVVTRTTTEMNLYTPLGADARAWNIADAVTYRWDGVSAWKPWESDWITWGTALTNFTSGNGTVVQRYKWTTGRIYFDFKITLGSTSAMGTNPTINLPVSIAALPSFNYRLLGESQVYDLSATAVVAFAAGLIQSVTTVRISTYSGSTFSSITSAAPMTWTTGDVLAGGFWADPA